MDSIGRSLLRTHAISRGSLFRKIKPVWYVEDVQTFSDAISCLYLDLHFQVLPDFAYFVVRCFSCRLFEGKNRACLNKTYSKVSAEEKLCENFANICCAVAFSRSEIFIWIMFKPLGFSFMSGLTEHKSKFLRMRSSREVKASDSQCRSRNGPGFDPSILWHNGIRWAADEAVLNIVHKKKKSKKPLWFS